MTRNEFRNKHTELERQRKSLKRKHTAARKKYHDTGADSDYEKMITADIAVMKAEQAIGKLERVWVRESLK